MKTNADIQQKVMDKIIAKIEAGKFTWKKPWSNGILPMNYQSKKPYQGINFLFTFAADFESPFYLTYNQVKELKGYVRKDSEGTPIIFYKQLEKTNIVEGKEKKEFIPILKSFTVFNENQIEGVPFKKPELNELKSSKDLEAALSALQNKPQIKHTLVEKGAKYQPSTDIITMPLKGQFNTEGEYYSTLLHELIHSTGAAGRLNREGITKLDKVKGDTTYSFEELIAEIGASYLLAMFDINTERTDNNNAAYLKGWLKTFKEDKTFLFKAAKEAQKAVNYILMVKEDDNTAD
jgi:antirestriction protein ArdC